MTVINHFCYGTIISQNTERSWSAHIFYTINQLLTAASCISLPWTSRHVIPLLSPHRCCIRTCPSACACLSPSSLTHTPSCVSTPTGAARASCTWSWLSAKTGSTCWDRTALPLTPSQRSSISTLRINSQSEVQNTCPCSFLCWCRHSDSPLRSAWTSRGYFRWTRGPECPVLVFLSKWVLLIPHPTG